MLIVCPSCATSYDVEPASLLPGGRTVRCLRCHTAWHAERAHYRNVESDSERRNALPTTSASAAGHPVHVNRAAGRERIASLDAFEVIREQAHEALNAIRSRCREDHTRILHRLGAPDAIPPPNADKPLAEAAKLPLQPRLPDAGLDSNTRIKISRAFAEAFAKATHEIAWANECADALPDDAQPRPAMRRDGSRCLSTMSSRQTVDPAQRRSTRRRGADGSTSPAGEPDTAPIAALDEIPASELNEFAEIAKQHFEPVDLDVVNPPIGPVDLSESRLPIEIHADDPADYADGPREEIQPITWRRHLGRAGHWAPARWPMSRLQTAILVLFVVDCILVGWRPEIVRALPQTSSFYKLVGLSVNLRGLAFDGVATTTEQHEGVPVLVVEGRIVNGARTVADVPRLKFIVRTASRQEIYSWTAVPSRTLLPPGEAVSFRTELASPPPDTHDVLIRFVDPRDIVAAEH